MIKVEKQFFCTETRKTYLRGDILSFDAKREKYLIEKAMVASKSEDKKESVSAPKTSKENEALAKKGSAQKNVKGTKVTAGKKS